MTSRIRRLGRLFSCVLMFGMAAYAAEPAKTVVSDTIYRADGSPASGTMVIAWPAFITADGKPVAAGSKTVKIGANGAVSISLVPTQGATPSGTYYKVVLSLDDGASSQEYWTVPTLSPTSIAAIRSSVVPATVAMQVVSREYVDGAVANTVRKTGDESIAGTKSFSSSPLVPSPSEPTAAANKDYVDVSVAAGSGSSTLALNKGGTGQTTWTSARCVRVANNGSRLESAPADCNVISDADMVDGQHAASFQAAMANAATLSKIAESGGNPLWNGSAWPGGGGSGNATQIQGKAVDTPDTARQFEVYDGSTAFKKWQDPVVRMNRDCGIVGTGDETAALNTCIANLPNYTGVLQCDKPGMIINSTGVVVRDKVSIRIETAGGGHTLNNGCQLIYTGAAGGTVIDVERTRDSVIFKGFTIYASAADIGFQTGQTGSGTNIATSDSFEEIILNNNNGRSTFIGFMIGDSTANNSDEMKFNHVSVRSSVCTKCGTAFKSGLTNVYGAEFRDISLSNMGVGWDWTNNASVNKVNGSSVALLYKLGGNGATFHVQHEDFEFADQILQVPAGSVTLVEENGRVILNTPTYGGVTGTSGHPAWDNSSGGNLKIRNVNTTGSSSLAGLTLLKGSPITWADVDFYDPGILTYGAGIGAPYSNTLNFLNNNAFLSGVAGGNSTIWAGRGFVDEKGMMVPGIGMQQTNSGSGLRADFTPCTRGNICFNEGQVELTGVHSIFNNPTISYTGTAGSTARNYAVVACDDTSCAAGHRSIPTASIGKSNTQAALDGSNYITLTWTPALGVNKYGILQQQIGSPNNWNLLMSNVSCSTNPCTTNITTDSVSYASGYPSDNETGGVILRGAIKLGKSATQPAVLDYTYASATQTSMNKWAQSSWTATASSTYSGAYSASKGIDGDTATFWLSATGSPPWTYDIDMGAAYPTSGLDYLPRSGQDRVTGYEIYLSSDGLTWGSAVSSGTWANDNTIKTAMWPAAVSRYVRLNVTASSSTYATVRELNLYSPNSSVATDSATLNGKHASDFLASTATLATTKTCTSTDKVSAYDASTGVFTCSTDQTSGGGSGIASLNGATATTQTLVDGANIHVSTNTSTGAHTIAVSGLGDAAAKNTGTTAGTVAAGDDSRFAGVPVTNSPLIAHPANMTATTTAWAFGDSITAGNGASQLGRGYVWQIANYLNNNLTNYGTPSAQLQDVAITGNILGRTVLSTSISYGLYGVNDNNGFGTSSTHRAQFKTNLEADMMWLALPDASKVWANAMTETGSGFSANSTYGMTNKFRVNGNGNGAASWTGTATGTTVYVVFATAAAWGTSLVSSITVDGVDKTGAFGFTGATSTSPAPYAYSLYTKRISGLSAGAHTVVVNAGSMGAGTYLVLGFIAGNNITGTKPQVYVGNCIRKTTGTYSSDASDTTVGQYNTDIAAVVSDLAADGLNVVLLDVNSVFDPNAGMTDDGTHPNDWGHTVIARYALGLSVDPNGGVAYNGAGALEPSGAMSDWVTGKVPVVRQTRDLLMDGTYVLPDGMALTINAAPAYTQKHSNTWALLLGSGTGIGADHATQLYSFGGYGWLCGLAGGSGAATGDGGGQVMDSSCSGWVLGRNGTFGISLKATAAITGPVPVKADTSNANQVVVTTTTDTGPGIVLGICENQPTIGKKCDVVTQGVVPLTLGTGTCAIGQAVIVDTTTNGRVKCTSTPAPGTAFATAMAAQSSVGSTFNAWISPGQSSAGFGDAAAKNTGATTGTLAAGDDSRITGALAASALNSSLIVGKFNSGTCSGYLKSDGSCDSPGGSGTVTHTGGALTSGSLMVGAGSADVAVLASDPINCTGGQLATGIDKTGAAKGCTTVSGTGTVTHTGNLTAAKVVLGNGTADTIISDIGYVSPNFTIPAGGAVGSADTGTPKFTFGTNSITASQPLTAPSYSTSGSTGGTLYLGQGTAAATGTTAFGLTAPSSLTSYNWTVPAAENASAGVLHIAAASSHISALTISAVVDGDISGLIGSAHGGTANGFTKFSGPTTAEKTFTLPNASATVLTTNALVTSAQGGTGNGFTKFSGPTTAEKTFTLPDASATVLTSNAAVTVAQGGTGLGTLTAHALYAGNATSAPTAITVPAADSLLYSTTAVDPSFKALPTTGTNGCSGSGDALQWNNSTHAFGCVTGLGAGGSGTVNSGTAGHIAYYATSTTAVSDGTVVAGDILTYHTPATGIARTTSGGQTVASTELSGDVTTSGSNVTTIKTSVVLTTPNIGAATGTSLLVTGIVDGTAPVTVTTACPTGAHCSLGATYKSGYTFNQHATAATAVFYDLPATAVGLQYCVKNSIVSGTGGADTGVITIIPAASSYLIKDGTIGVVSHGMTSGGAAGDAACVVAVDATHWEVYVQKGTWTLTP